MEYINPLITRKQINNHYSYCAGDDRAKFPSAISFMGITRRIFREQSLDVCLATGKN